VNERTIREVYAALDQRLGTRDTRKLAHNTYARRDGSDIIIRFHATDILTYHGDDTVTLAAGGWHTVTTARRFADYLPRLWSVANDRGVWNVFGPTNERRTVGAGTEWETTFPRIAAHFRFWDGMTITDTPRPLLVNYREAPDFHESDSLARELGDIIDRYAHGYDRETVAALFAEDGNGSAGDCFYCLAGIDEPTHLLLHALEGYRMVSTVRNAYRHKGYGNPDLVLWADVRGHQTLGRGIAWHVRNYLRDMILPYGAPAVTRAQVESARREVHAA